MNFRTLLAALATAAAMAGAGPGLAATSPAKPAVKPMQPVAAQAAPAAAPAEEAKADEKPYILGPDDVLDIQVLGRTDFNVRPKIAQDGTIQLPFIGSLSAGNMTTKELAEKIRKELVDKGYFTNPILSVEIVGFSSRYVTVLGEIVRPGQVPVDRPLRLSDILARVGGARDTAAEYLEVRTEDGKVRKWSVKELAKGDPSQDPYIQPGDKIFAPKAELFFVSGAVNQPGTQPYDSELTVRQAIARAGGLNALGSDKSVKVTHKDGTRGKLKLQDKIQPGDVIVIGERLF